MGSHARFANWVLRNPKAGAVVFVVAGLLLSGYDLYRSLRISAYDPYPAIPATVVRTYDASSPIGPRDYRVVVRYASRAGDQIAEADIYADLYRRLRPGEPVSIRVNEDARTAMLEADYSQDAVYRIGTLRFTWLQAVPILLLLLSGYLVFRSGEIKRKYGGKPTDSYDA